MDNLGIKYLDIIILRLNFLLISSCFIKTRWPKNLRVNHYKIIFLTLLFLNPRLDHILINVLFFLFLFFFDFLFFNWFGLLLSKLLLTLLTHNHILLLLHTLALFLLLTILCHNIILLLHRNLR